MISSSTDKKEIRKFGLIAFIFFGVLCCLAIWRAKEIAVFLFGLLSLLGVCFLSLPEFFRPVYYKWLSITHVIGRMITLIILTTAYYIVMTPAALIKRLIGGRPLPVKPNKKVSSYWIAREEPAQKRERFIKRY